MALKAGYYGIKKAFKDTIESLIANTSDMLIIKSLDDTLSLSDDGELSVDDASTSGKGIVQLDAEPTKDSGNAITSGAVFEALAAVGSGVKIVTKEGTTNAYAWLYPVDADNNVLKPSEVVLLAAYAYIDMSGAPPYPGSFAITCDTVQDNFALKLLNTQTGGSVSDGTYTVTYTVAYIEKTA